MKIKGLLLLFLVFLLLIPARIVHGQSTSGPTYIVKPGDTLNEIALRFGVTVQELIGANGITNPNVISAGTELIIPGLEGVTGTLTSKIVTLGETLRTLSNTYKIPKALFVKLNRITSPIELYVGSSVIIPSSGTAQVGKVANISSSKSVLDFAQIDQSNAWEIALANQTDNTWNYVSGDAILLKPDSSTSSENLISPLVKSIDITPLPIFQGTTVVIKIASDQPLTLKGSLNGMELHFFESEPGQYVALQGVHAMAAVGLAQFTLNGSAQSDSFTIDQMILLKAGGFGEDPALFVPSETIDPAVTKPEDDIVKGVTSIESPNKLWNGQWQVPLEMGLDCIKSRYGNRRSYNGSDYTYFHTGVDFGVCAPTLAITAAADGIVVYTGSLTVRGNTTIIDHGWGVFSAYYHQNEIMVKVGDKVSMGQQIGVVGATGRVTGPHLHFEIWVNGIQVQPLDWLYNQYP